MLVGVHCAYQVKVQQVDLFYETLLLMWHQGGICDFSLDLTHLWKQTD